VSNFQHSDNASHVAAPPEAEDPAAQPPQQRRGFSAAEKVGTALAVIGVLVAVLTWLFPGVVDGSDDPGPATPATQPGAVRPGGATSTADPRAANPPPASSRSVYLNTVEPLSGKANTTRLPRALQGQAGYDHAIVLGCPSNQSNDKQREVGYPLRARYLDFRTAVRGYSPADPASRAELSVLAGIKQRDGTLAWREASQVSATNDITDSLTASVEGADELKLQVRCDDPEGVLILLTPQLTG
jgi:hypothetical protein